LVSFPRRAARITEADRAVLSLKTQRRKLGAYQQQLEASVRRDTVAAKQLLAAGLRDRALLALRKRASTQVVLGRVDGWVLQVEETLASLDSAARTQALVAAMRSGADVLKAMTESVQLADVEGLMDDTAQGVDAVRRLQSALGGGEGVAAQGDSEAERELEAMEAEMEGQERREEEEEEDQLPSVPTARPEASRERDAARRPAVREEAIAAS
jgi:charged multivesicular body protein 6